MPIAITQGTNPRNRLLRAGLSLLLAVNLVACASLPTPKESKEIQSEVMARASQLLERYAANDPAGVIELIDKQEFTMFGTDIKEVVHSNEQLQELMRADFALWYTARISDIRDVDFRTDGRLATAFFTVSFEAGGMLPIPVRIATTWIKRNGEWFLTQSANSVPTQGQSALDQVHGR